MSELIVTFCRWRVHRNGLASGRWLRFADWVVNPIECPDCGQIPAGCHHPTCPAAMTTGTAGNSK